jgi:hypothetical protein
MSRKTKLLFAGLLCAGIALLLIMTFGGAARIGPPDSGSVRLVRTADSEARMAASASPMDAAREATAGASERTAATMAETPPRPMTAMGAAAPIALGGVVLDLEAQPVAGVAITCNGKRIEPVVRTNPDGSFEASRERGMATLGVEDERYVTVLEPTLFDSDAVHPDLTIVVAPRVGLAGVVVDTLGQPIAGAEISVTLGLDVRPRIERVLDRCVDAKFEATTPDDGAFALDGAPLAPTARVHIVARGHCSLELSAEEASRRTEFVLQRTTTGDVLEGIVVDEHDQPIAQAVVWLPSWSVVTAPDGTFRIETWKAEDLPPDTLPELTAVASGRLKGSIQALSSDWRSRDAWPRDLRIRLGEATERIAGRVLRADGTPVADVQVTFAPPEPEQIQPTMFDPPFLRILQPASQVDSAAGRFETARVVPGSYRLRVFDPRTLDLLVTEPLRTGTKDVELRLSDRGLWPALSGAVVDRRGAPVAGADWIVERDDPLAETPAKLGGPWHQATPAGRIENPPLSRDVHTLCVKAAGMAEWQRFELAALAGHDFRIVVPIGCQARVEVGAAWGNVDKVGFVDLAGGRSPVVFTHGNTAWGDRDIPIQDGRSQTFVALDDCAELLLFRGDEIVARSPVVLRPGEMNVLRP